MRYCKLFFGNWRFLLMIVGEGFSFAFFNNSVIKENDLLFANDGRTTGTASSFS